MNTAILMAGLVVLLVTSAAVCAAVQESDKGPPMPRPLPQHAFLAKQAGTWDAEVEMAGQKSRGVETCAMKCGGFWLVTDFEGEAMGMAFSGHGMMGFDPQKQKFHGGWVDSMGGPMTLLEGTASADGKTLTCFSEEPDQTGTIVKSKHVTTIVDANQRSYVISTLGANGAETVMLRIKYTKRRA